MGGWVADCPAMPLVFVCWHSRNKNTLFWRVFARFLSCFLLFHRQFVYNTDILEKIRPSLLFLAAGTTGTKFRRSTGVATANWTNKYQKYKSVELGVQLVDGGHIVCPPQVFAKEAWTNRIETFVMVKVDAVNNSLFFPNYQHLPCHNVVCLLFIEC